MTVSGKGDGGMPAQLPRGLWYSCFGIAAAWILFTVVCYVVILIGGFVKDIGRGDMTMSLTHFAAGFGVDWGAHGPALHRLGVGQLLHDDRGRGDVRAADRGRSACSPPT